MKFKTGDSVKVICGKDRGKVASIIKVIDKTKVLLSGVNFVKKHMRPSRVNAEGGIIDKEMPIDISNVMHVTDDGAISRVGFRFDANGKKERFLKKTNSVLSDKKL